MDILGKVEEELAEGLGHLEDLAGRPLYSIDPYVAEVEPDLLYRGSWPSANQLLEFKRTGFQVMINLCSERNQDKAVAQLGMAPVNIVIHDNHTPTLHDVRRFLAWTRPDVGKAFVHCEAGIGRTGCMVAAYRVLHQGWSVDKALSEAWRYGLRLPNQVVFIRNLSLRSLFDAL